MWEDEDGECLQIQVFYKNKHNGRTSVGFVNLAISIWLKIGRSSCVVFYEWV